MVLRLKARDEGALAELYERVPIEADVRDVPADGFVDQCLQLFARQTGIAFLNIAHCGAQHLFSDRVLDEFRHITFLAAVLGEIGASVSFETLTVQRVRSVMGIVCG